MPPTRAVEVDALLRAVNQVTGCPPWLMRSGSHETIAARGRAVAAIAMRDGLGLSTTRIARELDRSQSSIVELMKSWDSTPEVREAMQRLSETEGFEILEAKQTHP
jgi:hypothetical protein